MAAACRRWAHTLVLLIVLPLAFSSTLPVFARALGGPEVHTCHCGMAPGHCDCPRCHPDRPDLLFREMSQCGRCGDDDVVFGASLGVAVVPAPPIALLPPALVGTASPAISPRLALVFLKPPTPPPRLAFS